MKNIFVTATPPTPNGGLHLGHLAGPYLGADVFSRFQKMQGHKVTYLTYGDANQSFVVTTAKRKNLTPQELIKRNNVSIVSTMLKADIEIDGYKYVLDNKHHSKFVQEFFLDLYEKGIIIEKYYQALHCDDCNQYLFESFIEGLCPFCKKKSSGNLCENCARINNPNDLESPICNICKNPAQAKEQKGFFFSFRNLYTILKDFYESRTTWRPTLIEYCRQLIDKGIPDYPVSYPTNWGIPVPVGGNKDQSINVWFEMYPGIIDSIKSSSSYDDSTDEKLMVQFLGFDNCFFNSVLHVASALVKDDEQYLVPEHIYTNHFYLLEKSKFSTSKNHVIWAEDFLQDVEADTLRYYLSLTNPEHNQTNFELQEYFAKSEKLKTSLDEVIESFLTLTYEYNSRFNNLLSNQEIDYEAIGLLENTKAQLDEFLGFEHFSLRKAAIAIKDYLEGIENYIAKYKHLSHSQYEIPFKSFVLSIGYLIKGLAYFTKPIMPKTSDEIFALFSISTSEEPRWENVNNELKEGEWLSNNNREKQVESVFYEN
ncbi:class I tRNA ligase family protein [Halobacillus sp. B23F22_1]|uniref:class I tRNA ligase family protein n=1 Tax=Halobacillus sp. B23F22_1 TaxID=3459514 RepID=UPI00373E6961